MGQVFRLLVLFFVSFAMGCGDARTLDSEQISKVTSKVILTNGLTYPLSSMSSWVNQNYGACGSHYFAGRCHNGADIVASVGTPVYAVTAGTVISRSARQDDTCSSYWGYDATSDTCNMALAVRHLDASGEPFVSIYGHLRYDANVTVGTTFTAGQQVGVIGPWHDADDNVVSVDHLHWGIKLGSSVPAVWGRVTCSGDQESGTAIPSECNSEDFVAPGTFMAEHFPTVTPFSHHDPPKVCMTQPTGSASTNWYYSCNGRSTFTEGEQVWVLLRLHDVVVNHRFKIKAYKDNAFQWDWTTNLNVVGSGTWQYSHFWPELTYALPGEWRFDLFVIPEGGPNVYVDSGNFTVYDQAHYQAAASTSGYSYDRNGYTCQGPIVGGENTNWIYTGGIPNATFNQGDTVYGLVRLDDITANFRYSVDTYKEGAYQWNYTTGWNNVGQWGWSHNYFWTTMQNAQQGNWEFRVSVDKGNGFSLIDKLSFAVSPSNTVFEYDGELITCRGPVTGGQSTNWLYTCANPTGTFSLYQPATAIIRINNVKADFRWKTDIYANGVFQWSETTNWNDIGAWGWEKSQYWPTTNPVWLSGSWEYRIHIDTGNGFQYLDSAFFTVN
jgi:hypothetical protein